MCTPTQSHHMVFVESHKSGQNPQNVQSSRAYSSSLGKSHHAGVWSAKAQALWPKSYQGTVFTAPPKFHFLEGESDIGPRCDHTCEIIHDFPSSPTQSAKRVRVPKAVVVNERRVLCLPAEMLAAR